MSRLPALPVVRTGRPIYANYPEPGFWLVRVGRLGAPLVPAMIAWCGHEPGNPVNILDTGPILVAELAGQDADPIEVWQRARQVESASGRPIDESDYRFRVAELRWIGEYGSPDEPLASPHRKADLTGIDPIEPELPETKP